MSFYATLPGLPAPLSTFGVSTPADKGRSQPKDAAVVPSWSDLSSSNLASSSAFKDLALLSTASDNPKAQHPSLAGAGALDPYPLGHSNTIYQSERRSHVHPTPLLFSIPPLSNFLASTPILFLLACPSTQPFRACRLV